VCHAGCLSPRLGKPSRSVRRRGLALAAALLAAGHARATPLPREWVPDTARWVAHVNVETLRASQAGRQIQESSALRARLAAHRERLGADPLRDFSGVTLFGDGAAPERWAALVSGNFDATAMQSRWRAHPGYAEKRAGTFTLRHWQDRARGTPLWGCFWTGRLLVLASAEPLLVEALDALAGRRPSLKTGKPRVALPAASPAALLVGGLEGDCRLTDDPLAANLLATTESATCAVVENAGRMVGSATLNATDADSAGQMAQVLRGLLVSSLLTTDAPALTRLVEGARIAAEGRVLRVGFSCPAGDAAALLDACLPVP
jgi:hypothetical protein